LRNEHDVYSANPIIATLILCASQHLSLKEHTDTGLLNVLKECENFFSLLCYDIRSFNEVLSEWITNASYLHEILKLRKPACNSELPNKTPTSSSQ
jgi:hypothetical protein